MNIIKFNPELNYELNVPVSERMIDGFYDGRAGGTFMEYLIASVFTGVRCSSKDSPDAADLTTQSGELIEVKSSAESTNTTKMLTSYEIRNGSGTGTRKKSQVKWLNTDYFAICRYVPVGRRALRVRIVFIKTNGPMITRFSKKEFEAAWARNKPVKIKD
jgi:hypothetical protein